MRGGPDKSQFEVKNMRQLSTEMYILKSPAALATALVPAHTIQTPLVLSPIEMKSLNLIIYEQIQLFGASF